MMPSTVLSNINLLVETLIIIAVLKNILQVCVFSDVLPDYLSQQSIWHTGCIDMVFPQNVISVFLLDILME